jgi:hypothetical protein
LLHVLMDRLLGRDRFQRMKDAYCGLCILALYFLYLMVVKGALSVFDCSKVPWVPWCTGDWSLWVAVAFLG